MPYTVTKIPDGDVNFGNLNGEFVRLQPVTSDYVPGGYALISGVQVVDNNSLNQNIDLYQLLTALPAGGQGGYVPVFNPTTSKLQVFQQSSATSALTEVPSGTSLSAYSFLLLLLGNG